MVEQDYLSTLRAIAIPTATALDGPPRRAGDFKLDELEVAVDTPDRNERVVNGYLKHCKGRQGLCFAVTVAHAEHLAETFQTMGVQAAMVSGETSPENRKQLLHDYERSLLQVLCNVGVLTEGYDCPQTSCIIMARPTQSRALYVQATGRGTRKAPGKRDCIILDITDNCLKHRLEPLSLSTALGKHLQDGESILEANAREEREREQQAREAGEAKERTISVTRRERDVEVDVLARMDWRRNPNGVYVLEVGEHKHRILLFPSDTATGFYSVWAKLAPDFRGQQWCHEVPLEWAMQHAEIKARLLQSEKKALVDNNAPWRSFPVSNKQLFMLRK